MERILQPELLDELAATDPRAVHSRQDLCRINSLMGNSRIMAEALRKTVGRRSDLQMVELGAGDGEFLLRVAHRLGREWSAIEATLVDQHELPSKETDRQFRKNGWRVHRQACDVFQWLQRTSPESVDVFLANLFLHHFQESDLRDLFARIAPRTNCFIAVEPHRARWPLFCSRLLSLMGCNQVTCHDAPASVSAGFKTGELSSAWPDHTHWELIDERAGLFSQLFIARRKPVNGVR